MNVVLDSVVLATADLPAVRSFYRDTLGLPVGTYRKDGIDVPDESETYVNFQCGAILLGFEVDAPAQLATLVVKVPDLARTLEELALRNIRPERARPQFAVIRDPEGREIILQA